MAIQVSYPGVYIDEFTPGAPIEGVGTSTAAFLGVNKYGPPNKPTRITSWDGFLKEFWDPAQTQKPDDTDYLWYAVRGFFQNGGQNCYVIAVSNAKPDSKILTDMGTTPKNTVKITARDAGASSGIQVKAEAQSAVQSGKFFKPSAGVVKGAGNVVEVTNEADAEKFLAGDAIQIWQSTTAFESAVISQIKGKDKLIRLASALHNIYTTGAEVKLDAFQAGARSFRAERVAELAVGSAIRITQTSETPLDCRVTAISAERIPTAGTTHRVTVDHDVSGFDLLATSDIDIVSQEFKLTVKAPDGTEVPYEKLAMDPGHPRYFSKIVGDSAGLVFAEAIEPPNTTPIPGNRPDQTAFASLGGGANYDETTISVTDYQDALALLARIDDINLVAAPGHTDQDVQPALIAHCEKLRDRFALLETPRAAPMFGAGGAEGHRPSVNSPSGYAALYYPWLLVSSVKSTTGDVIPIPPAGHVAGIYARTDGHRGVHKAPAGVEATVNGVVGVATSMSDDEQGLLNKIGVNVVRVFQAGGRAVVWGARTTATTATNASWQYVNIRRLFLFLEESIQEGIRWAVFEPNNQALWQKLKRSISAFLTQQWRDGALFGAKAEEAFYVRIDEVLNPDNERALGRLYIEIGVRPSYTAEFIIVRIGIWQGGSEVSEG